MTKEVKDILSMIAKAVFVAYAIVGLVNSIV